MTKLTKSEPNWMIRAKATGAEGRVHMDEMKQRLVRTCTEKLKMLLGDDCAPRLRHVYLGRKWELELGYATGTATFDVDSQDFVVEVELRSIGHENYIAVTPRVRSEAVFSLRHVADALGL